MSGDMESRHFNPDDYQAEARLKGKIVKEIYVPGRIVGFVVK